MIKENVSQQLKDALKAHDELRLSTMRMLLSAINYDRINKMHELSEAEEIDVVRKEAKKRSDAIEMYEKAGETERAEKEKLELAILNEFLPKGLSTEELTAIVDKAIATAGSDFGAIMKLVMAQTQGRADGRVISEMVRAKLQ